jgi:hypothetical protein
MATNSAVGEREYGTRGNSTPQSEEADVKSVTVIRATTAATVAFALGCSSNEGAQDWSCDAGGAGGPCTLEKNIMDRGAGPVIMPA